ncbi:hypothetical protein ALC60_13749 [Trachymyrmex zeteki]|uniref:THAP-type domain-containing protein n=1 Tax=Mycetomoellerius zeteki TaxID=64791 RepID=A0A151WHG5_9HYME|nr:hypothetical protein ALC60_13749 [Trachymyrmex zeteki]
MPNKYCVLCGNRNNSVSYYTFPKNKELCKQWLLFCGIGENILNTATKLCSNHFEKNDIIFKAKGSVVKLNAVPCIKKRRLQVDMNDTRLADETADDITSTDNQSSNNITLEGISYGLLTGTSNNMHVYQVTGLTLTNDFDDMDWLAPKHCESESEYAVVVIRPVQLASHAGNTDVRTELGA